MDILDQPFELFGSLIGSLLEDNFDEGLRFGFGFLEKTEFNGGIMILVFGPNRNFKVANCGFWILLFGSGRS